MYFSILSIYLSILSIYGYAHNSQNHSADLNHLTIEATINIQKSILLIPRKLYDLGFLTDVSLIKADFLVGELIKIALVNKDKEDIYMEDFYLALKNYDDFLLKCAFARYLKLHPNQSHEVSYSFIFWLMNFWLMTEQLDIETLIRNESDKIAKILGITSQKIKIIEDENLTQLFREILKGSPENIEEYFAPNAHIQAHQLSLELAPQSH
jgi:hypothetical protein